MGKNVFIAEKPSVASAFGDALANQYHYHYTKKNGYWESDEAIITWCVGHLVSMSYPNVYDEALAKWSLDTIPFIPQQYKYEVIPGVKKQFDIVKGLLTRPDVDTIYICTDSGREGEYIYRLVDMQAGVTGKVRKRVWIDSQTEEEILRGIREAKDDSEYDALGDAAYLRAQEDYLMGINFSRALTLKYRNVIRNALQLDRCTIAVGRVMTCVLGIVVNREREIRAFVKTPFYRVISSLQLSQEGKPFDAEWRVTEDSHYFNSPALYSEKGFKEQSGAQALIASLGSLPREARIDKLEKKKENKNAPLLYNLAELQNDCSRFFKISPDQTLAVAQELYEKKMTTYPRTDARVLSTAIAKVIDGNIKGLLSYEPTSIYAKAILSHESYKGIAKTRYVDDKAITDHYAIIPTGQGLKNLSSLSPTTAKVYEIIVRRFLAIFYPPAVYQKAALECSLDTIQGDQAYREHFYANFRVLLSKGYLHVMDYSFFKKKESGDAEDQKDDAGSASEDTAVDEAFLEQLQSLRKGSKIQLSALNIKEGETTPPKRYNTGAMILTMENAGQFIEDDTLREQIRGAGIGTSATRAGILTKLFDNRYLNLNPKTQIITPTQMGEMIYETVGFSMKAMLNPALTASWEKGLTGVADGSISREEYTRKLDAFVRSKTDAVKQSDYSAQLRARFEQIKTFYPAGSMSTGGGGGKKSAPRRKTAKKS